MREKDFVKELFDGHTYGSRFDCSSIRRTKKVNLNQDLEEYNDRVTKSNYHKLDSHSWWYDSSQNVRWGLVQRFLERQVGRPWSKVWSDVKKMSKDSSKTQALFLERAVKGQVTMNATKHTDGTVTRTTENRYSDQVYGLYVDIADGILKIVKGEFHSAWKRREAARQAKKEETLRKIGEHKYLVKDKDTWYELLARPNVWSDKVYLLRYSNLITRERGEDLYEVKGSRRTLSHKEKKELGLL